MLAGRSIVTPALLAALAFAAASPAHASIPADSLATRRDTTVAAAATDTTVRAAPDFMLPDLDGVPRRFFGVPGRVRLLVYWSSECPECLHEMPRLARLLARERDRGLAVVSVTYPRLHAEAAAYAKAKSLGFPVLLDTGGQVAKLYRVTTTPTVFLVRDGRIVITHEGFDPAIPDPVEPAVNAFLR
jgi:peroxiredoxin